MIKPVQDLTKAQDSILKYTPAKSSINSFITEEISWIYKVHVKENTDMIQVW